METWEIAVGALLIAIAMTAVLVVSTRSKEIDEDGCDCKRICRYGVDPARQELYWQLVEGALQRNVEAERQLYQLAAPLQNHRACHIACGDDELKAAFCSVWTDVETKGLEQGW